MAIEVDEITAPACWASALVNRDRSGLTDNEERELNAALERWQAKGWRVVDVKRNEDGEGEEPRFTWYYDMYGGTARGGDVIDYVIFVETKK